MGKAGRPRAAVYSLCLERHLSHARHYAGTSMDVDRRLSEHYAGGAPPDAVTFPGNMMTHIAAWCGHGAEWRERAEALAVALACGEPADARNEAGESGLHVSAKIAAGVVTVSINAGRFTTDPQYSDSATYEMAYSTDSTGELLARALNADAEEAGRRFAGRLRGDPDWDRL